VTPAPPRPGLVIPGELLARVRSLATAQRTSDQEVVERVLARGLEHEEAMAQRVQSERANTARSGQGWEVPPFEAVLEVYRTAGLVFPGSVNDARAAWFDRWRRPPPITLDGVLGALRADARRWRDMAAKGEDRYVVSFAKWIQSGRETLQPELLVGQATKSREPSKDEREARARAADEQAKRHDPQAARVGLCRCDPCVAIKQQRRVGT
jgi:hypothetical protein